MRVMVKAHRAGLFSLLNNVISCMLRYREVSVDWSNSPYGQSNLWEHLFWPFTYTILEVGKTITDYESKWLTAVGASVLYQSNDQSWRDLCYDKFKQISQKPCAQKCDLETDQDWAAVLVRCNAHAGEQVDSRNQSLPEYAEAIESSGASKVMAVCGDEESFNYFRDQYDAVGYPGVTRVPSRSTDKFNQNMSFQDAELVFQEVTAMSKCGTLIHPVSNMATAALYMNPQLKSIYLK